MNVTANAAITATGICLTTRFTTWNINAYGNWIIIFRTVRFKMSNTWRTILRKTHKRREEYRGGMTCAARRDAYCGADGYYGGERRFQATINSGHSTSPLLNLHVAMLLPVRRNIGMDFARDFKIRNAKFTLRVYNVFHNAIGAGNLQHCTSAKAQGPTDNSNEQRITPCTRAYIYIYVAFRHKRGCPVAVTHSQNIILSVCSSVDSTLYYKFSTSILATTCGVLRRHRYFGLVYRLPVTYGMAKRIFHLTIKYLRKILKRFSCNISV